MKQLLEAVNHNCINLKELTVRETFSTYASFDKAESIELWLDYWMATGFIPSKINFVCGTHNIMMNLLLMASRKSMSNSTCGCGILKFYGTLKVPMDLVPVFPIFQVEVGQTAALPLVKDCIWGFSEPDLLLLTDCTYDNQVLYKASLRPFRSVQLNRKFTNLELLTEFNASYNDVLSNHLEQLAIACPNLQRLNLEQNGRCLKSLQGLRSIAMQNLSQSARTKLDGCIM